MDTGLSLAPDGTKTKAPNGAFVITGIPHSRPDQGP